MRCDRGIFNGSYVLRIEFQVFQEVSGFPPGHTLGECSIAMVAACYKGLGSPETLSLHVLFSHKYQVLSCILASCDQQIQLKSQQIRSLKTCPARSTAAFLHFICSGISGIWIGSHQELTLPCSCGVKWTTRLVSDAKKQPFLFFQSQRMLHTSD